MALFTKNETDKLQAELARLEKKRTALSGRLVSAQAAELAAIESRRRHLVESDDIDLSSGSKMAATIETAQRDRAAIEGAIGELDRLIAEGRQAVTAAKEASARQRRAGEISKKIERLEPLCAEAEKAFERLADIMTRIIETADCPDLVLRQFGVIKGPGSPLPAATLAGAALTEALFRSLPDGFAVSKIPTATFAAASLPLMVRRDGGLSPDLPLDDENGAGFRPLPLSGALTANLIEPLRGAAAEILSGERPLASATKIITDDIEAEPFLEYRRLVFTRPVRWTDWKGQTITTPDSDQTIPAVVAEAAIRAGAAHEHGTKEAEAHLDRRYRRGVHNDAILMNKESVDLRVTWPATTREAA